MPHEAHEARETRRAAAAPPVAGQPIPRPQAGRRSGSGLAGAALWVVGGLVAFARPGVSQDGRGPSGGEAVARATLPFSARAELPSTGKPVGVLLHDFDGDGRARLVAATFDPGTLHVWTDPLAPPTVIPIPDYPIGPELLELATLDAVAVASRSSEEMLVYSPTAEDPAKPLHRIPLGARPHAMGAGPLLSGEAPSVVVATLSGELVVIDHRGTARFPLVEGLPTFVAVEPGRVIVGSQEDPGARAYVLTPDGGLEAGERLGLPGIPRDYLRFETSGGVESWIVGGERELWRTGFFEEGARGVRSKRIQKVPLRLAAIERAEPGAAVDSDVVYLSANDLGYAVLAGGRERHRGSAGQDPWGVACGDLDGDGAVDLAFANRGARRVSVVLGRADGSFHEALRAPVGRGPHSLTTADLDGDGLLELLAINAMDQELVVLGADSADSDRFAVVGRYPAAPAGDALASADVDGDGNADVGFLVRAPGGARLRVLFGDGEGTLETRPSVPDVDCGSAVGDLWLGRLESLPGRGAQALVADPAGGVVHLFGFGPEGFAKRATVPVPTSPAALCVEGSRVFVAVGEPGPRVGMAELEVVSKAGEVELVERAFYDDGLPMVDVALLEDAQGESRLALLARAASRDGAGWFVTLERQAGGWRETGRQRTGLRPYALDAGDLDGDGVAEVVVGAQNSHHVNLWKGSAEGFVQMPDVGVGRGVLDVLLADLGTGRGTALVVANAFSNDLSVVRPR